MTLEQQIKALAELDGWTEVYYFEYRGGIGEDDDSVPFGWYGTKNKDCIRQGQKVPNYLTSYDAIIPLRVKVCNTSILKVAWLNSARSILARRIKLVSDFDIASIKPDEDCEALLRATNKWKD